MGKSAYNFFVAEIRPKVKEENPNMSFGDISKKVGEMWKNLSAEERKPYEEKAEAAKQEDAKHPKEKKEKKERKCRKSEKDEEDSD